MVGHQKLHIDTPCLAGAGSVGLYNHSLLAYGVAGSGKLVFALYLNHTYAAGSDIVYIFQITKVRNVYSDCFGSFHYGSAVFHLKWFPIYNYIYHLCSLPPLNAPYP